MNIRSLLVMSILYLPTAEMHANAYTWIKGVLRNPATVGAIAPCSAYTARALVRYVRNKENRPLSILEVGAGTGAITQEIIKYMGKDDHLDCIELDQEYCAQLAKKIGDQPNVRIHALSITDFNPTKKYDVIISTLPFNSLPSDLVVEIVEKYKSVAQEGCYVSYIEYIALGTMKRLTLNDSERLEWDNKQEALESWRKQYGIGKKIIMRNMPPAYVYYLKLS